MLIYLRLDFNDNQTKHMHLVYCDDFERKDNNKITLIHAAFGIKENEAIKLSNFLKDLKQKTNINTFHCRDLFNGDERRRKQITSDFNQITEIYSQILYFVTELGNIPQPLITFAQYSDKKWKEILSLKNFVMKDEQGNQSTAKFSINSNTLKFHLEQANNLRLFAMLGSKYFFYREKIDKENCSQKIGEYKNRGIMPGMRIPTKIDPEGRLPKPLAYDNANYKEIFEVADFIAYVCGTILHGDKDSSSKSKNDIFQKWYHHINPLITEFSPNF